MHKKAAATLGDRCNLLATLFTLIGIQTASTTIILNF